jgi:hypothetical protein
MKRDIEKSLNTAFASAKMEGYQISPKIEADCRMLLNGNMSVSEYIRQFSEVNGLENGSNNYVIQP